MRRILPVAFAALLALTTFSGATWGAGGPTTFLVGYDPDDSTAARAAIAAAGGTVRRSSAELGFSVVDTSDPNTFLLLTSKNPVIQYVETDSPTRLDAAQWNGAQWNAAQWNGAQWNGAQWNGAQWNGAQWNGAQWNGAQWNAAQWNAFNWSVKGFFAGRNAEFRFDPATTDPGLVWQWGSWVSHVPKAWASSTGTLASTLCVLDSGVSFSHADTAPNLWRAPVTGTIGWNAIDPSASADDDAGHGTHVASVAAGAVGNAYGVAGVANERIMPVKVLDSTGHGRESDLAFGLVFCANNGANVALMALEASEPGPTMDRALQYAADHDVLLVASAGNAGPCTDCVVYPGSDPRVLAVAALDGTGALAPFSSQGPEVALVAAGTNVLGAFPGPAFVFGSGTSQAAAYVAGVAALVRDVDPTLTSAQTSAILLSTAQPRLHDVPLTVSAGLVDAKAAADAARA